ncbi:helix-turn-helix transcriptional regulator [Pseudonocardia sp. C8]|uniref:helix-turn-helix transcriptional regulator n=1 Tax=Pseudonocardia sp. C8 TaxID=2762759 RepID=UPI00351C19B4
MDDWVAQVSGVGALAEPARRALYLYVAEQPEPVSRDQAAEGAGVARHTAKFHLDKLVDEGLLDVEYRRLSGRRGPGAGRPAKLYRRADRQVAVTLPPRHYDLAGRILARAVEDAARTGVPVLEAVRRAAAEAGHRLCAEHGRPDGPSLECVVGLLAAHGYEPRVLDGAVELANCPFHALAQEHTALVCEMNLHLVDAVLDELGPPDATAALDPAPGRCCVRLTGSCAAATASGPGPAAPA